MPRLFTAKVILYFIFLTALDAVLLPIFQIHSVYPSFLYLLVCYAAFEWGSRKTVYVAFWVGLIRDFLGGGLIGVDACILTGLALVLDFLVQKMEREFPGIYTLITFIFIFCAGALRLFFSYPEELLPTMIGEYLGLVFFTALYTSALLPFFYFMTDRWFGQSTTAQQYELFR